MAGCVYYQILIVQGVNVLQQCAQMESVKNLQVWYGVLYNVVVH